MISSSDGFWALLHQWKNDRILVDATVFLHRGSNGVLVSTIRGSIDVIDENNNVQIAADTLNIMRFNLLNAKVVDATMAEVGKSAKSYAEQLRHRQDEAEYLDPILQLILHEDGEVKMSVILEALRPATVQ